MEAKLDRMTEMVGDGCNTAIPSSYCDTSGADKVGQDFYQLTKINVDRT